jgi:hypothetical protein
MSDTRIETIKRMVWFGRPPMAGTKERHVINPWS